MLFRDERRDRLEDAEAPPSGRSRWEREDDDGGERGDVGLLRPARNRWGSPQEARRQRWRDDDTRTATGDAVYQQVSNGRQLSSSSSRWGQAEYGSAARSWGSGDSGMARRGVAGVADDHGATDERGAGRGTSRASRASRWRAGGGAPADAADNTHTHTGGGWLLPPPLGEYRSDTDREQDRSTERPRARRPVRRDHSRRWGPVGQSDSHHHRTRDDDDELHEEPDHPQRMDATVNEDDDVCGCDAHARKASLGQQPAHHHDRQTRSAAAGGEQPPQSTSPAAERGRLSALDPGEDPGNRGRSSFRSERQAAASAGGSGSGRWSDAPPHPGEPRQPVPPLRGRAARSDSWGHDDRRYWEGRRHGSSGIGAGKGGSGSFGERHSRSRSRSRSPGGKWRHDKFEEELQLEQQATQLQQQQ